MITSIAFTVYPVMDMARSRNFYEGVLGLTLSSNFEDVWVEYDLGDSTFAITTTEMGHTPGAKGAVVAFEVSDLDVFVNTLKKTITFYKYASCEPLPKEVHLRLHDCLKKKCQDG